jgi:predicted lipase
MPSATFSIPEAIQLGRFVLAAYDLFTAGDPPGFVPPDGYSLVAKIYADDITDGLPDYKVFGYIARSGADVVVAIRGTENIAEWVMDSFFVPVLFPYVNAGRTEKGFTYFYSTFHTGADANTPRVLDVLRGLTADGTVQKLRIAGHSLGSALATLLAIDVAGNGVFTSPTVYTFASPRVGDKVFAGTYDSLVPVSWRIANLNDIVTHLPPSFAGYVHVDAEVPINSDDRTRHNFHCWHALLTYMNTMDSSVKLDAECVPK